MTGAPLYTELAEAPETGEAFWINRAKRGAVRAAVWPGAGSGAGRGTVFLFTGRTEYIEKYGRVISELTARGFAVATLDWRGQGLSRRSLDDPMKGHVADFANYQFDVEALLNAPQVSALPGPRILICHSMGGCIGMRTLLNETLAPVAAIFSAPMLGIGMSRPMRIAAVLLVAAARRFGFERSFAPTPRSDQSYVGWQPFEGNLLTNDEDHYFWMRKHLEAEPGFALGSPTLGWMGQAMDETRSLAQSPPPDIPTLTFLGDQEEVVDPAAIRRFHARAPLSQLVELKGAKHEAFMETPEVRAKLWSEIDRFLAAQQV